MADENPPILSPAPKKSGWMRALAITLLIVVVVGMFALFWVFKFLFKNEAFKKAFSDAQARQQCKINLEEIGGALERYSRRNKQYPATLDLLYPNYLENQASLHCPSDPKPGVSYDYYPPAMNAPPKTLVAECQRHIAFENQPPWKIQLFKDGTVTVQGFLPRNAPPED